MFLNNLFRNTNAVSCCGYLKSDVLFFRMRSANRMANIDVGIVSSSTKIIIGVFSITGFISWSYPAGISSTAAASEPSVSVHQCAVYAKKE